MTKLGEIEARMKEVEPYLSDMTERDMRWLIARCRKLQAQLILISESAREAANSV